MITIYNFTKEEKLGEKKSPWYNTSISIGISYEPITSMVWLTKHVIMKFIRYMMGDCDLQESYYLHAILRLLKKGTRGWKFYQFVPVDLHTINLLFMNICEYDFLVKENKHMWFIKIRLTIRIAYLFNG